MPPLCFAASRRYTAFHMTDWPHSPLHRLGEAGAYMVTAGTYGKLHILRTTEHLTLFCERLMSFAKSYYWDLQAWAVFSNHYHVIATTSHPADSLRAFLRDLHSGTSREFNQEDGTLGRKVWYQFWDSHLTFHKSYCARLNYVHQNAVHHGLVKEASLYPWCSAGWFQRTATPAFFKTVSNFPIDRVKVPDDFQVSPVQSNQSD